MALNSTDTTFTDIVRERRLIPEDAQNDRSVTGPLATVLLTPLGASAQYYSKPADWARFIQDGRPSGVNVISRDAIVHSLFRMTSHFDNELALSLTASDPMKRSLARLAFQIAEEKSGRQEFYHGLFHTLLFDKFSWALNPVDDTSSQVDTRPIQMPYINECEIPKSAEKVYDIYRNWPETVSTFAGHWVRAKDSIEVQIAKASAGNASGSSKLYKSNKQRLRGILGTLVDGVQQSESMMQIALAENNFCMAAIGLFGLFLVSTLIKLLATLIFRD